jgi:hypothetical protein
MNDVCVAQPTRGLILWLSAKKESLSQAQLKALRSLFEPDLFGKEIDWTRFFL